MALEKTFTLPSGASGDYIQITQVIWDRQSREASANFSLFASAAVAASAPDSALCLLAKMRLTGAKFDAWLSTAALAAMDEPGPDPVRTALYRALVAELAAAPSGSGAGFMVLPGGGLTRSEMDLSGAVEV